MPHRILTPAGHSEETLEIAHDLLPPGYELVQAPHGAGGQLHCRD